MHERWWTTIGIERSLECVEVWIIRVKVWVVEVRVVPIVEVSVWIEVVGLIRVEVHIVRVEIGFVLIEVGWVEGWKAAWRTVVVGVKEGTLTSQLLLEGFLNLLLDGEL